MDSYVFKVGDTVRFTASAYLDEEVGKSQWGRGSLRNMVGTVVQLIPSLLNSKFPYQVFIWELGVEDKFAPYDIELVISPEGPC